MDFLFQYGLFAAKVITLLLGIVVTVALIAGISRRASGADSLQVENLNQRYKALGNTLRSAMLGKSELKELQKSEKTAHKQSEKSGSERARTFVIDFKGDLRASATQSLREEVSAVIAAAGPDDAVVIRLENPGGTVHEHGLAAAQLVRLRDKGIDLTVVVDKVAASGGYLMACVANKIVAAPFAILGSIGVLMQLPNFNRLLDKHGVDFEQLTAGKHKRSVTMFGKNTDADREKAREELEDVHRLFKDIVARYRSQLDIEKVATGEHWYGSQALELKLADELMTSDELLTGLSVDRDLFKISFKVKTPLKAKLMGAAENLLAGQR
ncbi:MAG: protease SohB [Pseudomonadota bacterium]